MKLRVLICLILALIVISDVTVVAATNYYQINVKAYWQWVGPAAQPGASISCQIRINNQLVASQSIPFYPDYRALSVIHSGPINTLWITKDIPGVGIPAVYQHFTDNSDKWHTFRIYRGGHFIMAGQNDPNDIHDGWVGYYTLNLPCPITTPFPISLQHALNFTLAGAMALPTMTIDIVDDIMLVIGKHIKCGIAKFAIRAALLKLAAKGVAVTVAITVVGYLFSEFADDIYNAIFITVPEINPGDTHFHETEIPQVMDVIDTYHPVLPHIRNAIEQDIRAHVDAHGYISIADVMTIIRNHQNNVIIDIYQETPEILPENIVINRYQVPEIMDMIDEYFPVELPIRNIIEEEIYRRIDDDEFNEIPFSEVIDIIEEEQNIFIPEIPTETPEEHQEYIDNIIDRIVHEDPYIPTIPATPCIFQGIPATPIIPRTPTRPKEEIHTFPFYSLFVDPMAAVMGITLAHLFAAMMIVGTIISIAASWGATGAILGGFMGTIMTSYFGLTSWLIPLYLVVIFIIYLNIKIRKGSVGE